MTEPTSNGNARFFSLSTLAVVLFVGLIQGAWWVGGDQTASYGGFVDGDSYTRLIRVERLIETTDWFDISIPDANAPYGTTVHWTRLFDLILLAVSAPMIPFIGFAKALFWAGTIVSPLLHLATAAALVWALTPLLGRVGACFAGALSAAQMGVMVFGIVGRADHHMLFALLIALSIGFLSRSVLSPETFPRAGWGAGLSIALGLWVGPEFLLFMGLGLGALGLRWLFEATPESLKANIDVASGLCVGLFLWLFIERGISGVMAVEYDRISLVHMAMGALLLAFWQGISLISNRQPGSSLLTRTRYGVYGVVICLALMVFLFPKIIGNPLNDADLAIQPIYAHISEYQPINDFGRLLIYFGSLLFAVPWLVWRLKSTYQKPGFWIWLLIALCLAVFASLGINWIRWCLYAGMFLSILIADLIFHMDQYISRRYVFPKRLFIKVFSVLCVATGPLILGALILFSSKTPEQRLADTQISCPLKEMAALLNKPPFSDQSRIIVASANFGPELIYRTRHKAVATVHHRNVSGILDGHKLLQAVEDDIAKKIIKTRGINLVLLCPGSSNDKYFLTDSEPGALYRRLVKGQVPEWLAAASLPEPLRDHFKLFEVKPSP